MPVTKEGIPWQETSKQQWESAGHSGDPKQPHFQRGAGGVNPGCPPGFWKGEPPPFFGPTSQVKNYVNKDGAYKGWSPVEFKPFDLKHGPFPYGPWGTGIMSPKIPRGQRVLNILDAQIGDMIEYDSPLTPGVHEVKDKVVTVVICKIEYILEGHVRCQCSATNGEIGFYTVDWKAFRDGKVTSTGENQLGYPLPLKIGTSVEYQAPQLEGPTILRSGTICMMETFPHCDLAKGGKLNEQAKIRFLSKLDKKQPDGKEDFGYQTLELMDDHKFLSHQCRITGEKPVLFDPYDGTYDGFFHGF